MAGVAVSNKLFAALLESGHVSSDIDARLHLHVAAKAELLQTGLIRRSGTKSENLLVVQKTSSLDQLRLAACVARRLSDSAARTSLVKRRRNSSPCVMRSRGTKIVTMK